MGSNDKLKETDIKNYACYYVDDMADPRFLNFII